MLGGTQCLAGSNCGRELKTGEGEEKMGEESTVHPILCIECIMHPTL